MAIVEWDGSLAVGVEAIDRQHRELFRIINSFHDKIGREEDSFALAVVLDSLKNYVTYHFGFEEKLLERNGCPELAGHQALHDSFAQAVERFEAGLVQPSRQDLLELQTYLLDWLVNHIQAQDLRLAPFMKP